jgi:hypothetical protein
MLIRIPRTAARRSERTYALLLLHKSRSRALRFFRGRLFETGARVEESALWPTRHYPRRPLLVEYAGSTGLSADGRRASGHNRSRDLYILWRFDPERREWDELARTASDGPEWYEYFQPIVAREIAEREIIPPGVDQVAEARAVAGRLVALIEGALDELADEGRDRALSFLYDQIAARFAASLSESAAALRPLMAASAGSGRAKRERAA